MIDMDTRSLLTDALTPPAGSHFDCGVATTFSLDLVTLLGLPLHLAWMGSARQSAEDLDLLALLEALRRTAGRLTVFCQRARIQAPRSPSPVLGLLETMVHEVTAPHGGVFHPKVWLLRFASHDTDQSVLRLLVLSRNLTDDRSWDVALKLEGEVGKTPKRANQPLSRFLEHTMRGARKEIAAARAQDLQQLLKDASCCAWELPGRFEEIRFHALGIAGKPRPWLPSPGEGRWDELGVISPFVGQRALAALCAGAARAPFLIARAEELDALADPHAGFATVRVLSDEAAESDEEDDVGRERGLHAKVFVGKRGWNTHLFVGSANATEAALLAGQNVEFMAELVGRSSKVGRPCDWLGEDGLGPALLEYVRSEPSESQEDLAEQARLEQARRRLASAGLSLACVHGEGGWKLALQGAGSVQLDDIQATAWPVSLRRERSVTLGVPSAEGTMDWGLMGKQDLTSMVAFGLVLGERELTFALDLPIEGLPADRDLEILRSALKNREGFLRYLLLLLGEWDPGEGQQGLFQWRGKAVGSAAGDQAPVFELLARAYAREPQRLTQVKQVIERLCAESQEQATQNEPVLPPEFLKLWSSFEQAMREDAQ